MSPHWYISRLIACGIDMQQQHQSRRLPRISNHHGDSQRENHLPSARAVLEAHPEIDIVEIDFVCHNEQYISMHDYTALGLLEGSHLTEWIDLVVVQRGLMLWVDLKPRWDLVSMLCDTSEAETLCLMRYLDALRNSHLTRMPPRDIRHSVLLASQDYTLSRALGRFNSLLPPDRRWCISEDVPFVGSYILQWVLPYGWQNTLNEAVRRRFAAYDFSHATVVSIDALFFEYDVALLGEFIRGNATLRPETWIILYSFDREKQAHPITLDGYPHIITQYNHSCLRGGGGDVIHI